jgi:hypothetical protein
VAAGASPVYVRVADTDVASGVVSLVAFCPTNSANDLDHAVHPLCLSRMLMTGLDPRHM